MNRSTTEGPRALMRRVRSTGMERYVIHDGHRGFDRLEVLARVHGPDTSALLDRVGVGTGMDCLDLGCGGGAVTLELAHRVGPAGRVTGVDADENVLVLARETAAAQGVGNVEFKAGSAYDDLGHATYDLVYSRFLAHHLSRPVALLRGMWAAVRTGGALVIEDADFDGTFGEPPNEGVDTFTRLYAALLQRNGGDPAAGRKLFGYFHAAGIQQPHVGVVQLVSSHGEAKELRLLTFMAITERLLADGLASQQELDSALARLGEFIDDPNTILGSPRVFRLWARK